MIQDIFPHRLWNEYRPDQTPKKESPILCFRKDRVFLKEKPEKAGKIIWPAMDDFPPGSIEPVFAFRVDETDFFLHIGKDIEELNEERFYDIRSLRLVLDNVDGMIIFTGSHLHQWYGQSRFCGCCGALVRPDDKERAMVCTSCGNKIYPRLQPAVIVGVIDKDKLLVTKYRNGFNHYALIAGFTEIGETLEETVRREVMEEAGLKVRNIRYYKSQPWGIAQDVLAGFFCELDGVSRIRMDHNELRLAEWKSREEIELQPDSYSLTNEMMRVFKEKKYP